jgi:hypothetical protein
VEKKSVKQEGMEDKRLGYEKRGKRWEKRRRR